MEIKIDKTGSNDYYGEVLAVMSDYSKLFKNPKQKIRGLNKQAVLLTGIALAFLIIFSAIYLLNPGYTLALYVIAIFAVAFVLGIIYNLLVRRRISKFRNNDSDKKLLIEEDYVEMHIGGDQFRLNFTDIQWIIFNKYSIAFLPKTEGSTMIAIEIRYKSQVLDNIKEKSIIVDNSNRIRIIDC